MEDGSHKTEIRLHRAVIVLFCLALLVALMRERHGLVKTTSDSVIRSWKNGPHPGASGDAERCTADAYRVPDEKRIQAILDQLTDESRIPTRAYMMNKAILSPVLAKASRARPAGARRQKSGRLF